MDWIDNNNILIHAKRIGEGKAITMLHGLIVGSIATWYFCAAGPLAKNHQVILYDLRGHGKSERVLTGYDVNTMARDLESVLNFYQINETALVGHSYGALVALQFALENPGRVSELVLVEAPIPVNTFVHKHLKHIRDRKDLIESLPVFAQQELKKKRRGATRLLKNLEFLFFESSLLDDLASAVPLSDKTIAALDCPVHCIYGNQSECRPAAQWLVHCLPNSGLSWIPGGHFLPVEQPRLLSKNLEEYFNGTD